MGQQASGYKKVPQQEADVTTPPPPKIPLLQKFMRRRPLNEDGGGEMNKCLTTIDLISLGVGSCCGAGMYLTSGIIAAQKAGPGGVISLLLAGIGSALTGLHYAELAGLCPHTSGSAYMYSYITVGELAAFVIGWGLIVEYVIGTSAAAVALSEAIHSLSGGRTKEFLYGNMARLGIPKVDVFATVVCLVLTWLLASGVQMSAKVNNVLNGLNFLVWVFFLSGSVFLGSYTNWTDNGFAPFGIEGILTAIPVAYFAFIGFDGLSTTGAECKTPIKSIPFSIIASIVINIVIFIAVLGALTWDVPYNTVAPKTSMLDVFVTLHHPWMKYVIAVGAVSGLFAATFGSLFPLPRVVQAMSQDGLFFKMFAKVCPKRQTALRATVVMGLIATFLAAFVGLTLLIELVLIGTLLAYLIVIFATLVVRFVDLNVDPFDTEGAGKQKSKKNSKQKKHDSKSKPTGAGSLSEMESQKQKGGAGSSLEGTSQKPLKSILKRREVVEEVEVKADEDDDVGYGSMWGPRYQPPESMSYLRNRILMIKDGAITAFVLDNIMKILMLMFVSMYVVCSLLSGFWEPLMQLEMTTCLLFGVALFNAVGIALLVMILPQIVREDEGFTSALIPLSSGVTAAFNIFLMTQLQTITWILFSGWMVVGMAIYLFYGTSRSTLNPSNQPKKEDNEEEVEEETNIDGPVEIRHDSAQPLQ